jgi:hypothetical protein
VPWWSWIPLDLNGDRVATNPLARVLLAIVLGDADSFKILGVGFLGDVQAESREAIIIIIVVVSVGSVPSPCLRSIVGAFWRLALGGASP